MLKTNNNVVKFNSNACEGTIETTLGGDITVRGYISDTIVSPTIIYWAANPPTYNSSYSGSGMPYSSASQAYENTLNQGVSKTGDSSFCIKIKYPNSYYIHLGTVYVPPHLNLMVKETGKTYKISLGEGVPFRMLTYPALKEAPRCAPGFYHRGRLPVRSQEQILRDGAYPSQNIMPRNFWGLTVPHA